MKIARSYTSRCIVSDFSTQIMRGDLVLFIGADGAGKTTLLDPNRRDALRPWQGNAPHRPRRAILDQRRETLDPAPTRVSSLTIGADDTVSLSTSAATSWVT
jgi:ATPase subunit of ABC transporter with duplicated ATPase domains